MKKFVLTFFVLVFSFCSSALTAQTQQYEAQFFSTIRDIPLMPGLKELTDQTLVFDKPEGRIIESVAEIESQSVGDIKHFYQDTLPQLGWTRIAEMSYVRQDEHLYLDFETYEGQNFMRVMVSPYSLSPK